MDIRMPVMDGIQATREIAATRGLERVRVLSLPTYDTDAYLLEALQAGASGFMLKDGGPADPGGHPAAAPRGHHSYGSSGARISTTLLAASSGISPSPGWKLPVMRTHWSRAGTLRTPTTRSTTGAASAAQQAIW